MSPQRVVVLIWRESKLYRLDIYVAPLSAAKITYLFAGRWTLSMVHDLDSIFNPQMNWDIHQRCSFLNPVVALYAIKLDLTCLPVHCASTSKALWYQSLLMNYSVIFPWQFMSPKCYYRYRSCPLPAEIDIHFLPNSGDFMGISYRYSFQWRYEKPGILK